MRGKHKRKREEKPAEVDTSRFITPMLDMTFQLLSFFILSFNPTSIVEGQMALNLPASGEAKARDQSQVDPSKPSDTDIDLPSDYVVVVKSTGPGGGIAKIAVRESAQVTEAGSSANELYEKLRELVAGKDKSKLENIKIETESSLKYSCLVEVMDACVRAGFTQVGFAPPTDLAGGGR